VAWISYLRWVVLSNVVLCCRAWVPALLEDFPAPAATYRPAPAVGRVARPGTGPMSDRTRLPLATRRRHLPDHLSCSGSEADPGNPKVTQAHREREQAQGTLGTAAHSTRALETGQNRVPCARTQCCVRRPEAGDTGVNEADIGSLPGARTLPAPGARWGDTTLAR
jgi:hypothetical protein